MSLAVLGAAWEAQIPPSQKLVLLAITECSGGGEIDIWERNDQKIGRLTSLDPARIEYAVHQLMLRGVLIENADEARYADGECYEVRPWGLPGVTPKRSASSEAPKTQPVQPDPSGYVYVISGGGYSKIGRAKDPDARLKNVGVKMPFPLRRMALIYADDYFALEAELHEQYASKRREGEWFSLTPEDIEAITRGYGGAE